MDPLDPSGVDHAQMSAMLMSLLTVLAADWRGATGGFVEIRRRFMRRRIKNHKTNGLLTRYLQYARYREKSSDVGLCALLSTLLQQS